MNTYFAGLIFGTVYEFDHRQAELAKPLNDMDHGALQRMLSAIK